MRIAQKLDLMRKAVLKEAEDIREERLLKAEAKVKDLRQELEEKLERERNRIISSAREESRRWLEVQVSRIFLEEKRRRSSLLTELYFDYQQKLKQSFLTQDEAAKREIFSFLLAEALDHLGREKNLEVLCPSECVKWVAELQAEWGFSLEKVEEDNKISWGVILKTIDHHQQVENTLDSKLAEKQKELQRLIQKELGWFQ